MIKVYGSWCIRKLGWLTEFHATLRSSSNFSFFILLLRVPFPLPNSNEYGITKDLRLFFFFSKYFTNIFRVFLNHLYPVSMLENLSIDQRFPRYIYACSDKWRQKRRVFRETSYFFLSLSPDIPICNGRKENLVGCRTLKP